MPWVPEASMEYRVEWKQETTRTQLRSGDRATNRSGATSDPAGIFPRPGSNWVVQESVRRILPGRSPSTQSFAGSARTQSQANQARAPAPGRFANRGFDWSGNRSSRLLRAVYGPAPW